MVAAGKFTLFNLMFYIVSGFSRISYIQYSHKAGYPTNLISGPSLHQDITEELREENRYIGQSKVGYPVSILVIRPDIRLIWFNIPTSVWILQRSFGKRIDKLGNLRLDSEHSNKISTICHQYFIRKCYENKKVVKSTYNW